MAVLMLCFMGLVAVTVCGGIPKKESGNFPLDGCFTDEMDVMFLYYEGKDEKKYRPRHFGADKFAGQFEEATEARRVQFAGVHDSFSASNTKVNVSSWHFKASTKIPQYKTDEPGGKKKYNNVNKTIELKIEFVNRLFSEMAGVRENATHVALIFLDGSRLSFEESRSVPHIVQQQASDIKIFVVVFSVRYVKHIVYMRDTFLVGYDRIGFTLHSFMLAICNQCLQGWFSPERGHYKGSLSCYYLFDYNKINWHKALSQCINLQSSLATIETEEELNFLQTHLQGKLIERGNSMFDPDASSMFQALIFIGLRKDSIQFKKRFYWSKGRLDHGRSLVINHWLPGKPSIGLSSGCGVWRFDWKLTSDDVTNLTSNSSRFVDGWEDVGCKDAVTNLNLSESVLPRRVDNKNMMRVKPASNESFSQALTKGEFRIYRDNIVSVSANIASRDFVEYLEQTEHELFPIFDCGVGIPDPRYISYIYVCDSVDHCSNRRDEMFCLDRSQVAKSDDRCIKRCGSVYCCDDFCLPLGWVGDGQVDCNVCGDNTGNGFNDESEALVRSSKKHENCSLFCNDDDECVHFSQLNDGRTDCTGPDGPLDETIGKLETADTCYNILGHRIWAPRCVYVKDRYAGVLGCRDMSHLKDCVNFECPEGYFKCPNTYCIPQHYVLDGTLDCPTGEEENYYTIDSCTGNFACWNSTACLHPDLVCNGHPDCLHQDDEVDCHIVTCVEGLRCISGTVTNPDNLRSIPDIYFDSEIEGSRNRYLNLSGIDLSDSRFYFPFRLNNVTVIIFSHCNISNLNYQFSYSIKRLQELDISNNHLRNLGDLENYYSPLEKLRVFNLSYNREFDGINDLQLRLLETLDLSHTSVSQLEESFLVGLPSLKHLDVSFTKISNFNKNTFPSSRTLLTLDLRGLSLKDFYENYFNGLTISQDLYTDSFELCCPQIRGANIQTHKCHAPDDAISSCFDLVRVKVQRVLLWVVAVLAVLGNMAVIVYRVIWDRSVLRTGYGLFVTNLGVSDFIMGVYLFIIAGADYHYQDFYVLSDKTWRESIVCRLAGFLATLSSETSTFFVLLITLDRFLVMKFPFGQMNFNKITKIITLFFSWIIGFLLALAPVVFRFEIYSSNAMCLGLPLTTKQLYGWEFSFGVFIVLNFCLFLLIVYGQRAIFSAMSENRVTQIASRRAEDITVAKQLSLVALSNFLCWFPVGLMGLLSLGGHVISNDVYAWTTVIVLPVNAAVNPLLYTIPAIMSKWERFKYGETRTVQTST